MRFLDHMNFKKIPVVLLFCLAVSGAAFGQQLKIKRSRNVVRVTRGGKFLYNVQLRGKPNERGRKYDEAFAAGQCLIVRRDVRVNDTGTEFYYDISRVEIYRASGKRKIYRESNIEIGRITDWELINSPDFTWAIIANSGEAMFDGYFYISPQCEIREVSFSPNGWFDWGSSEDGVFIDAATLKFPSLVQRQDGREKRANVFIMKGGNFRIEETPK